MYCPYPAILEKNLVLPGSAHPETAGVTRIQIDTCPLALVHNMASHRASSTRIEECSHHGVAGPFAVVDSRVRALPYWVTKP